MTRTSNACTAVALLFCGLSSAQTLPPPPVSPAPVTSYEYDANGNPTRTIQAPGAAGFAFSTRSDFDALNRRFKITDAKAGETQIGHDGLDRITLITDPRALSTQSPRNGLGDVQQLISPDTGTARHTYDAAGNLKTRTDSRNIQTIYGYDALNRLTSASYNFTKGGLPISSVEDNRPPTNFWGYDQQGPGFSNGVGRLTSTRFPAGTTQYAHDPQGRLLTDTQRVNPVAGGNGVPITTTVSYGYDAAGHVTSIAYPSGRVLTVTHAGGWPSAISLAKDGLSASQPLIAQIEHTAFGAFKGWQWNTATGWQAHDKVFDLWGRIVRYRLGSVVRDISYDEADRIKGYSHWYVNSGAPAGTFNQLFAYDELGRLTDIATHTELWTIGYDASGNRASVTRNGAQGIYTTPPTSNRLQSISNPPRSFGHDNAGNTTSDSGNGITSTYDRMGHLATLSRNGVVSSYTYNAAGQRVRKVTADGTLIFVYDQGGQLLGEYDAAGAAIREYVWLGTTPVAMVTPGPGGNPAVFHIHADHLDTPRVVQDVAGTTRWTWFAEPFGTTAADTNPSQQGAFTQNLRFPGQYADAESGLSYNYARQYDATIGRYAESDPIGLAGGINTYAYVGGNPVSKTDPSGLLVPTQPPPGDGGSQRSCRLLTSIPLIVPPGFVIGGGQIDILTLCVYKCETFECPPKTSVEYRISTWKWGCPATYH